MTKKATAREEGGSRQDKKDSELQRGRPMKNEDKDADINQEDEHVFNSVSFPRKLHTMLEAAETEGFDSIVSWLPDETSFKVHDTVRFANDFLPRFFNQSKYTTSFYTIRR